MINVKTNRKNLLISSRMKLQFTYRSNYEIFLGASPPPLCSDFSITSFRLIIKRLLNTQLNRDLNGNGKHNVLNVLV